MSQIRVGLYQLEHMKLVSRLTKIIKSCLLFKDNLGRDILISSFKFIYFFILFFIAHFILNKATAKVPIVASTKVIKDHIWVARFGYEYSHPKADVLHSAYFQKVASTADSMIMARGLSPDPEEIDDLISNAIAFTDKLIERVGER